MKTATLTDGYARTACIFVLAAAALLLAGCQTSGSGPNPGADTTGSDPGRDTRSGFLTDYAKLRPIPGSEVRCWRTAAFDARQYDKILISRILVTLKSDQQKSIDPTDLKTLVDYFHASLVKALQPQLQVVTQAGPRVLVMKIALTDLMPTDSAKSLLGTAVPYGFVVEAASGAETGRPAGSTPYLGETGVELQFADGVTGAILGECADTQIGRKYAAELDKGAANAAQTWATGYLSSFQAWSYAKDAFDKWSALLALRIGALRGVNAPPQ